MIRSELNERLKDAGLSKKDFAEKSGMSYGTVNNWGNDNQPVPPWVDSWLENFKAKKSMIEVKEVIKRSGLCDPV